MTMLIGNGFDFIEWTQLPSEGFVQGLPKVLRRCAALVAIIDGTKVAPAVLIEVGAALGCSLPVVVLTMNAEAAESLPPVMRELVSVGATGDHSQTGVRLAETLRAVIATPSASAYSAKPQFDPAPATVVELSRTFDGAMEAAVATALVRQGARLVPTQWVDVGENRRWRPDLAIWVDGLPHPGLNPVIVEVAGVYRDGRDPVEMLRWQLRHLRSQMATYACVLGLVVVRGDRPAEWHVDGGSAIATVGIDTLADQDLVRLLSDGRNRWAHGYR